MPRLCSEPEVQNVRLTVRQLTLMIYEASIIAGPLTAVCEFDLESQSLRAVDAEAMDTLFR